MGQTCVPVKVWHLKRRRLKHSTNTIKIAKGIAKGTVETITTLIGGIINGVVITTNGIHKEEINSIGTIRTIRTIRGNRGFGRNQWGHQNNNQPSHNNQSLQVYNPDEDQRMVSIEASIKKLSTQLGQLHDSTRRQDKGKAPNDHSERINMVTALGGAKQKGKKVAKESEQLSLHKAKNPYRPPINHDKMDEELSKIKLEMGPSHLERLRVCSEKELQINKQKSAGKNSQKYVVDCSENQLRERATRIKSQKSKN
ncbi:hypothetical protein Q3G72_015178 [Acer saccharum]|nr:hypothetical protein Q3G72_015178 [Acer saccharum]